MPNWSLKEYWLNNGLRVVINIDRDIPIITCLICYDIFALGLVKAVIGLPHIVEHLAFSKELSCRNGLLLDKYTKSSNIVYNALTKEDIICFYAQLPPELLPLVLWREAERMKSNGFSPRSLENAKSQVEMESRSQLGGGKWPRSLEGLYKLCFKGTIYANSIIGTAKDIRLITVSDAINFLRSYFKPSNAVLCLAGNVDETRAINEIGKHFADIKSRDNIIGFPLVSEPDHYKRYLIKLENRNRISVCTAVQAPPRGHEDTAVFHILKYIVFQKFANGMLGTFPCIVNADFIEKRALSLFIVYIEIIDKDDWRQALNCQRSLLSGFGLNASKDELDKAKYNFMLNYHKQMAALSRRALHLSERCLNGDSPLTISEEVDKPCAVSNQDIKRIVNTYFRYNNTRITEI